MPDSKQKVVGFIDKFFSPLKERCEDYLKSIDKHQKNITALGSRKDIEEAFDQNNWKAIKPRLEKKHEKARELMMIDEVEFSQLTIDEGKEEVQIKWDISKANKYYIVKHIAKNLSFKLEGDTGYKNNNHCTITLTLQKEEFFSQRERNVSTTTVKKETQAIKQLEKDRQQLDQKINQRQQLNKLLTDLNSSNQVLEIQDQKNTYQIKKDGLKLAVYIKNNEQGWGYSQKDTTALYQDFSAVQKLIDRKVKEKISELLPPEGKWTDKHLKNILDNKVNKIYTLNENPKITCELSTNLTGYPFFKYAYIHTDQGKIEIKHPLPQFPDLNTYLINKLEAGKAASLKKFSNGQIKLDDTIQLSTNDLPITTSLKIQNGQLSFTPIKVQHDTLPDEHYKVEDEKLKISSLNFTDTETKELYRVFLNEHVKKIKRKDGLRVGDQLTFTVASKKCTLRVMNDEQVCIFSQDTAACIIKNKAYFDKKIRNYYQKIEDETKQIEALIALTMGLETLIDNIERSLGEKTRAANEELLKTLQSKQMNEHGTRAGWQPIKYSHKKVVMYNTKPACDMGVEGDTDKSCANNSDFYLNILYNKKPFDPLKTKDKVNFSDKLGKQVADILQTVSDLTVPGSVSSQNAGFFKNSKNNLLSTSKEALTRLQILIKEQCIRLKYWGEEPAEQKFLKDECKVAIPQNKIVDNDKFIKDNPKLFPNYDFRKSSYYIPDSKQDNDADFSSVASHSSSQSNLGAYATNHRTRKTADSRRSSLIKIAAIISTVLLGLSTFLLSRNLLSLTQLSTPALMGITGGITALFTLVAGAINYFARKRPGRAAALTTVLALGFSLANYLVFSRVVAKSFAFAANFYTIGSLATLGIASLVGLACGITWAVTAYKDQKNRVEKLETNITYSKNNLFNNVYQQNSQNPVYKKLKQLLKDLILEAVKIQKQQTLNNHNNNTTSIDPQLKNFIELASMEKPTQAPPILNQDQVRTLIEGAFPRMTDDEKELLRLIVGPRTKQDNIDKNERYNLYQLPYNIANKLGNMLYSTFSLFISRKVSEINFRDKDITRFLENMDSNSMEQLIHDVQIKLYGGDKIISDYGTHPIYSNAPESTHQHTVTYTN